MDGVFNDDEDGPDEGKEEAKSTQALGLALIVRT
jgi:hypothetical protein